MGLIEGARTASVAALRNLSRGRAWPGTASGVGLRRGWGGGFAVPHGMLLRGLLGSGQKPPPPQTSLSPNPHLAHSGAPDWFGDWVLSAWGPYFP